MKLNKQEFVTIGKILAPWGNQGKLKVETTTDFPQRFIPSSIVYIKQQPMAIDSTEWHRGIAIIKLNMVNSINDAEKLKGQLLEIHHTQLHPLPKGQYYHFQLIGLKVWTTQGRLVGNITDILTTPSNDNYIVRSANGEILIPAIEDVIKSIDLNAGCLIIEPIEGLLNLNKKAAS